MTYYLLFAAIVSLGYCLLQIVLVIFWSRIPVPYDQPQRTPSVSIVVAFRDEADHLQALMNALVRQDYPRNKYEVILVDNHSKDDGLNIVRCYAEKHANISYLDLSSFVTEDQCFKKEALAAGIHKSGGEIILTTDADCIMGRHWISSMVSTLLTQNRKLVTGPVAVAGARDFLDHYQQFELAALLVATGGGLQGHCLLIGNGANLAFYRKVFEDIDGFKRMPATRSGDDVFLIQEIGKVDPDAVGFVKDRRAIVSTYALTSFEGLLQQRQRWASKSKLYTHLFTKVIAVWVAVNSTLIGVHLLMYLWFGAPFLMIFCLHLISKSAIDSVLIVSGLSFQNKKASMGSMLASLIINPFFNISTFLMGVFYRSYTWKHRKAH